MAGPTKPSLTDIALGAAVTVAAVGEALVNQLPGHGTDRELFAVTALALAAPLVWRRRVPFAVLASVLTVTVLQRVLLGALWDSASSLVAPLVAVYTVAAERRLRDSLPAYLATVVVLSVADVSDQGDSDWPFISLIFGAIWVAGSAVRRQRDLAARLAQFASELELAQAAREEVAAAEERARIAREMHDVVAHCVSTMVVQAEAGEALIDRDRGRAAQSFVAIQRSGREALQELRGMLGLLRTTEHTALTPQPTLARLDQLLDGVREAGLLVSRRVVGEPRLLPAGVDLSAYRIVQEALTNVVKHSEASSAAVQLTYRDAEVEVLVTDDGPGRTGPRASGGHGLAGMRERVRLHGGRLDTGARQSGGYEVRARLPL